MEKRAWQRPRGLWSKEGEACSPPSPTPIPHQHAQLGLPPSDLKWTPENPTRAVLSVKGLTCSFLALWVPGFSSEARLMLLLLGTNST